jgi:hypothetical protein
MSCLTPSEKGDIPVQQLARRPQTKSQRLKDMHLLSHNYNNGIRSRTLPNVFLDEIICVKQTGGTFGSTSPRSVRLITIVEYSARQHQNAKHVIVN